MGVIVKPKNLNDRQMKRVDRIEESNPLRARTVASRISERRDARGAENPQIAKAIEARRSMAQPMKKGGKMIKKAQKGGVLKALGSAAGSAAEAAAEAVKSRKPVLANNPLFKKASAMKDTTTYKKSKNGSSFGMLSVKAGVDKNPNPTAADRIAGAKGMAKAGKKIGKLAKQAATAIAMKKAGKSPKMKSGGTVSMQLGSYTRQIGKNYSGKAKMGKSMGKCKYGC